jgi:hypothetical protein
MKSGQCRESWTTHTRKLKKVTTLGRPSSRVVSVFTAVTQLLYFSVLRRGESVQNGPSEMYLMGGISVSCLITCCNESWVEASLVAF